MHAPRTPNAPSTRFSLVTWFDNEFKSLLAEYEDIRADPIAKCNVYYRLLRINEKFIANVNACRQRDEFETDGSLTLAQQLQVGQDLLRHYEGGKLLNGSYHLLQEMMFETREAFSKNTLPAEGLAAWLHNVKLHGYSMIIQRLCALKHFNRSMTPTEENIKHSNWIHEMIKSVSYFMTLMQFNNSTAHDAINICERGGSVGTKIAIDSYTHIRHNYNLLLQQQQDRHNLETLQLYSQIEADQREIRALRAELDAQRSASRSAQQSAHHSAQQSAQHSVPQKRAREQKPRVSQSREKHQQKRRRSDNISVSTNVNTNGGNVSMKIRVGSCSERRVNIQ